MCPYPFPILAKDEGHEGTPEQFLSLLAEVAAVRLVNEGQCPIGPATANQLILIFSDNASSALLPEAFSHVTITPC